jgi:hypothetical protein
MSTTCITSDLRALLAELGADPLRAARIDVAETRDLEGVAQVWAALDDLPPREGWLCLTDEVVMFPTPTAAAAQRGRIPLDGEWTLDAARSAHLRHLGEGRWRLTVLRRVDDPDGTLVERSFYRVPPAGAPDAAAEIPRDGLRYEVAWAPAPDAFGVETLQPRRARFAGFCDTMKGKSR